MTTFFRWKGPVTRWMSIDLVTDFVGGQQFLAGRDPGWDRPRLIDRMPDFAVLLCHTFWIRFVKPNLLFWNCKSPLCATDHGWMRTKPESLAVATEPEELVGPCLLTESWKEPRLELRITIIIAGVAAAAAANPHLRLSAEESFPLLLFFSRGHSFQELTSNESREWLE